MGKLENVAKDFGKALIIGAVVWSFLGYTCSSNNNERLLDSKAPKRKECRKPHYEGTEYRGCSGDTRQDNY